MPLQRGCSSSNELVESFDCAIGQRFHSISLAIVEYRETVNIDRHSMFLLCVCVSRNLRDGNSHFNKKTRAMRLVQIVMFGGFAVISVRKFTVLGLSNIEGIGRLLHL